MIKIDKYINIIIKLNHILIIYFNNQNNLFHIIKKIFKKI